MMLPFGSRALLQSGLGILIASTVSAAANSPGTLGLSYGTSVVVTSAAAGARLAQAVPDRSSPTPGNVPNAANVSLQMFPDQTAGVGTRISFRVTAKKPGYVMLIDIDANGRMSQIFPNPELIAQSEEAAMNFIKPGEEMQLPNAMAKKRGFRYVTTPPVGATAVVAILSDRKVQILDLPDSSQKTRTEAETLSFLTEWTNQLRVPDPETGKLLQSNWSFDIKRYRIQ